MRRPRSPSVSTPAGLGESSQKNSSPPPRMERSIHTLKAKTGSHETRAYKVGRKHGTEAYGG